MDDSYVLACTRDPVTTAIHPARLGHVYLPRHLGARECDIMTLKQGTCFTLQTLGGRYYLCSAVHSQYAILHLA